MWIGIWIFGGDGDGNTLCDELLRLPGLVMAGLGSGVVRFRAWWEPGSPLVDVGVDSNRLLGNDDDVITVEVDDVTEEGLWWLWLDGTDGGVVEDLESVKTKKE